MVSDSGFINKELFVEWPKHFGKYARPTEDDPVLLIADSHMSYCSLEAVTFYRQHYTTDSTTQHCCLCLHTPVISCSRYAEHFLGHLNRCVLLNLTTGCIVTLGLEVHRVTFAAFSGTCMKSCQHEDSEIII